MSEDEEKKVVTPAEMPGEPDKAEVAEKATSEAKPVADEAMTEQEAGAAKRSLIISICTLILLGLLIFFIVRNSRSSTSLDTVMAPTLTPSEQAALAPPVEDESEIQKLPVPIDTVAAVETTEPPSPAVVETPVAATAEITPIPVHAGLRKVFGLTNFNTPGELTPDPEGRLSCSFRLVKIPYMADAYMLYAEVRNADATPINFSFQMTDGEATEVELALIPEGVRRIYGFRVTGDLPVKYATVTLKMPNNKEAAIPITQNATLVHGGLPTELQLAALYFASCDTETVMNSAKRADIIRDLEAVNATLADPSTIIQNWIAKLKKI